jgi:predicted PurR-regulated permease PerM
MFDRCKIFTNKHSAVTKLIKAVRMKVGWERYKTIEEVMIACVIVILLIVPITIVVSFVVEGTSVLGMNTLRQTNDLIIRQQEISNQLSDKVEEQDRIINGLRDNQNSIENKLKKHEHRGIFNKKVYFPKETKNGD